MECAGAPDRLASTSEQHKMDLLRVVAAKYNKLMLMEGCHIVDVME